MASTEASVLTVDSSENSDSFDDLSSTDDPPVEVISLLNSSFGDSQEKVLEDYVEASIMLQYNER